ncbi:hypothetical protein BJ508DRAFT_46146 [Ascobolus immersus RN42]|uniref:Uncharacterized protein n=1 Tax=Ascobolus immersus RN42 TaxID=1160509 RepID=A0A3N4ICW7_ASCIM|nr:hypothetical protein BJ508DRAFT_46146 [Ascobolus immersus RN42]
MATTTTTTRTGTSTTTPQRIEKISPTASPERDEVKPKIVVETLNPALDPTWLNEFREKVSGFGLKPGQSWADEDEDDDDEPFTFTPSTPSTPATTVAITPQDALNDIDNDEEDERVLVDKLDSRAGKRKNSEDSSAASGPDDFDETSDDEGAQSPGEFIYKIEDFMDDLCDDPEDAPQYIDLGQLGYMEGLEAEAKQKYNLNMKRLKKLAKVYDFVRGANPSNVELLVELQVEMDIIASTVQSDVEDCIPLSSHRSLCLREEHFTAPYAAVRALQPSRFNKERDGKKAFNQLTSAFYKKKRLVATRQPVWDGFSWTPGQVQIIGHSDLETISEDEQLDHINQRQAITSDSLLRFATRRP